MKSLAVITAAVLTLFQSSASVRADAGSGMKDSGIDYTEAVSTPENPGAGYTSSVWYVCSPGNTPVYNPEGNLVVLFIDIGAFSSGANGKTDEDGNYTEGTDYDLDDSFFSGVRKTLDNCRNNGCTVGIRFRYDADGKNNPEPSSFGRVLGHINQIAENHLLGAYEDILVYIESGFVGAWGEQHSGKYTSAEYKARLLERLLEIVPESVSVTVRTPDTFCRYAGIKNDEIAGFSVKPGSAAYRVGMYNDGYMGSDSDLGTYSTVKRSDAVNWMKTQMKHAYYGGEFSGNTDFARKYDTWLPENCISEMYDTHLSYINSNIWKMYGDFIFGEKYDIPETDNSAYYGQNVYRFIRDHLGYRFVLRDSDLTAETVQGGRAEIIFKIENTGFADVVKNQKAYVILENEGRFFAAETDTDTQKWDSASVSEESLDIILPGNIPAGEWNVYLKIMAGNDGITDTLRTVKFENTGVYDSDIGANFLGTLNITASDKYSSSTFSVNGSESSFGNRMFSIHGRVKTDGCAGKYEWSDTDAAAESDTGRIYLKSDDEYLYVCAELPDTAVSPVYNLSLQGKETGAAEFWTYYESGGYVYFNGEDRSGMKCGYSGGVVEFRIPYGKCMELYPGKELKYLRVDIQDSKNEWKVTGDLRITDLKLPVPEMKGDLNSDGSVNSADAAVLVKYLFGTVPENEICSDAADICDDGVLSVLDLILLKEMMLHQNV